MSLTMKILGWIALLMNSLCLLRLGILPSIYFGRNYALYKIHFWISFALLVVFTLSEAMLIWILLADPQPPK